MDSLDERLEEMRQRHRAIARYSVAVRQAKSCTVLFTGLHYDVAIPVCDQLQAEWDATIPGGKRFGTPIHTVILENGDECLTPAARERIQFIRDKKGPTHHG